MLYKILNLKIIEPKSFNINTKIILVSSISTFNLVKASASFGFWYLAKKLVNCSYLAVLFLVYNLNNYNGRSVFFTFSRIFHIRMRIPYTHTYVCKRHTYTVYVWRLLLSITWSKLKLISENYLSKIRLLRNVKIKKIVILIMNLFGDIFINLNLLK